MAKLETVKVVCEGGYKVVNKSDLKPEDKIFKERKPRTAKKVKDEAPE